MKTVYLCENSVEGILSGVYAAWTSRKGHANVKLGLIGDEDTMELFCQYEEVPVNAGHADKVVRAIREKISEEAKVVHMLQVPEVFEIFQMCRNIDNETHLHTGFVRFVEMEGDILVSRIGPKNDVLVLLAPHFMDRLSGENWVIYDENRKKAVMHPALRPWFLVDLISSEWEERMKKASDEDEYEALFQCFRKSISIKERTNPVCQRNHMPLRYRAYMPEFSHGLKDS